MLNSITARNSSSQLQIPCKLRMKCNSYPTHILGGYCTPRSTSRAEPVAHCLTIDSAHALYLLRHACEFFM